MNDLDLHRALRRMDGPLVPRTDLWPGIASRIGATTAARPRRRWIPLAAAAGLLLALGAMPLLLRQQQPPLQGTATTVAPADEALARMTPRTARQLAEEHGIDPRLAGAGVVLDTAHAELAQALEQRPDAVFLVSLLNRTNAQRLKLDRLGARAG
jgi:hypothetical protein